MIKHCLLTVIYSLAQLGTVHAQVSDYILKRENFNPGLISIHFSPDGKLLLAGCSNGSFRVLDPETFETSLEVSDAHLKPVTSIDMPPKMDFIMTAGGNQIKIWGRDGSLKGNLNAHATTIWNLDISQDGKHAVSTAFNKTFLLWDVYNGVVAAHLRGHEDVTLTACISQDNKLIASGSNDHTVKIWDLVSRQVLLTFPGPAEDIYDVSFSPDSKMLAVASADKSIRLYSLDEKKLIHVLKGHRATVRKVDFSPDGVYILSASEDQSMILWDAITGERIYLFAENEGAVLDIEFHPDGKSIYSVSLQGDLTRWDLNPEIFVLRYYETPYLEELAADPVFEPRRKGESKKEYETRLENAAQKKSDITDRYYQEYLKQKQP